MYSETLFCLDSSHLALSEDKLEFLWSCDSLTGIQRDQKD